MRAAVPNLLCSTLLIALLSCGLTLPAEEPEDLKRAECAERLARRQERLENFKFTFADPRQANLFKYLSARSFGRRVPMSALRSQLGDFRHLDRMSTTLPDEFIAYETGHTFCSTASTPNCSVYFLRAFQDRVQTIRDFHIDCWNSGTFMSILDERTTILPYGGQITDDCDALRGNTIFNNRYDDVFGEIGRIEACDEAQWKNVTGYMFQCHREKVPPGDDERSLKMMASLDEVRDGISSLFELFKHIDQNETYHLMRDQIFSQSGDFENILNSNLGYSYWEGLPFFESDDISNDVVLNALRNLVSSEPPVVKSRAFHLWRRVRMEMVNVGRSQSKLEPHYTKNRYKFDIGRHDLLKLVKAAGSNWRFKYVHVTNDGVFGVSIHNERIFGLFVNSPQLPTNPTIERVRRLLNSLIRFYWDVMASRGVHPEAPKDVDYTVTCHYKRLYDRESRDDRYDSRNLYRIIASNSPRPHGPILAARDFKISGIMKHLEHHPVYLKMAMILSEKFKDKDTQFRDDILLAITLLVEEFRGVADRPVDFPNFVYEKDFISKCREDVHCEFLLSLQMIGNAFDLIFVNEDSQEVFVGKSGLFVYFQSDEEPPASRKVRFLLNFLLHMFFNKDDNSME